MPLFVIQEHRRRKTVHFDLMLERGKKLAAWSLAKLPLGNKPLITTARPLPGHRRIYLNYEGKISRGRGSVKIWDKGTYQTKAWQKRLIIIILRGKKIRGGILLLRSFRSGQRWFLIKTDLPD